MHKKETVSHKSLIFNLVNIDNISNLNSFEFNSDLHSIIIFISGNGTLCTKDNVFITTRGKSFIFPPCTKFNIKSTDNISLNFYIITYNVVQNISSKTAVIYENAIFPNQVEFYIYPFETLLRLGAHLHNNIHCESQDLNYFENQANLYEILDIFYKYYENISYFEDSVQLVHQTIELINKEYNKNLTVKYLSSLANTDPLKYSKIFQTITGQKPLDYLTSIRINYAKCLLQNSNEPLREIAQCVGFNDEYYFNRRFSKIVGIPPKQYSRYIKQKYTVNNYMFQKIIFHGESIGDLVALNINILGSSSSWIKNFLYEDNLKNVQDIGRPINFEETFKLDPDLIIFSGNDKSYYKSLSKIAPTIVFETFAPLENRIIELGNIFDKKEVASNWINNYKSKLKKMWFALIKSKAISPGESASIFTCYGDKLYVVPYTGISDILYSENGFKARDKVQKLINKRLHPYVEIPLKSLEDYAGDRIFILVPPFECEEDKHSVNKLTESSIWKNLKAVKQDLVYYIDRSINSSDAFTSEWFLEEIPKILKNNY